LKILAEQWVIGFQPLWFHLCGHKQEMTGRKTNLVSSCSSYIQIQSDAFLNCLALGTFAKFSATSHEVGESPEQYE